MATGAVVAVVPFVFGETSNNGIYSAVVLGVLLVLAGFWTAALASPGLVAWIAPILGAALFFAPWLFGFTGATYTMWAALIAGALAVLVGGYEIFFAPTTTGRPVAN